MRDAMAMLLESAGLRVHAFASARRFLQDFSPHAPCCVVLDVRMPEMSGLQVHDALLARGALAPVVFVTAHGDVPMAVGSMRKGALDFLEKPFEPTRFLRVVLDALERDQQAHAVAEAKLRSQARLAALTRREQAVLGLVLDGKSNRVIAFALGITPKTVEFHRAHIMGKLEVESAAELVRFCLEAGFAVPGG